MVLLPSTGAAQAALQPWCTVLWTCQVLVSLPRDGCRNAALREIQPEQRGSCLRLWGAVAEDRASQEHPASGSRVPIHRREVPQENAAEAAGRSEKPRDPR